MARRKQKQPSVAIQPDMKILLELKQANGTDGDVTHLSLGSYVEEVMPDGCLLIKMPVHKGSYYSLPQYKPVLIHLFAQSRMYSFTVRFVDRVKRGNLLYAMVRQLSDVKPNQRRDCFRLQCTLPITIERQPTDDNGENDGSTANAANTEKRPPIHGKMINLSDGGTAFITNETFETGEIITLTFDIGTIETLDAKVLNFDKTGDKEYRHKVSVKFNHQCKHQKDRIYKYLVSQQLEILRKVGTDSELL